MTLGLSRKPIKLCSSSFYKALGTVVGTARAAERVGGPRANAKSGGPQYGLGSGGTPPGNFEILHALKYVLRAPEALFRACGAFEFLGVSTNF